MLMLAYEIDATFLLGVDEEAFFWQKVLLLESSCSTLLMVR